MYGHIQSYIIVDTAFPFITMKPHSHCMFGPRKAIIRCFSQYQQVPVTQLQNAFSYQTAASNHLLALHSQVRLFEYSGIEAF
jgi:hypothetical protein